MTKPPTDYAKLDDLYRRHNRRYLARAARDGLICQACGGAGGWTEVLLDDGTGPSFVCGFCEGGGYVTKWMRGAWLRWKKEEKRERRAALGGLRL
jgi:hypothetical protein